MTALARLSGRPAEQVRPRRRWPYGGPAQARMLLAGVGIIVGSVMPWVDTAVGTFTGLAGAGVWTLYAGVIGVGAAALRRSRLAAVNAAAAGIGAVGLAAWQGWRLLELCGGGACAPATGLVLVLAAGVFALLQVRPLWRYEVGDAPE